MFTTNVCTNQHQSHYYADDSISTNITIKTQVAAQHQCSVKY